MRRETTIRSPTPPPTPPDFGIPDEEVSSYDSDESFQAHPVPRRSTSLEYMSDPGVQPVAQNDDEGDKESSYDEDEDIESDESDPPDGHQFDSDFSGDSPFESDVPSDSDRGDDAPDRPLSPTPPDVLAAIPLALRYRVMLPRSGDVWRCPVRSHDLQWCPFKIDLYRCEMNPAAMLARGDLLSNDQMRRLRALGWSWDEDWVQNCFGKIVAAHYEWHINELGISYIQRGKRVSGSISSLSCMMKYLWAAVQVRVEVSSTFDARKGHPQSPECREDRGPPKCPSEWGCSCQRRTWGVFFTTGSMVLMYFPSSKPMYFRLKEEQPRMREMLGIYSTMAVML